MFLLLQMVLFLIDLFMPVIVLCLIVVMLIKWACERK